MRTHNVPTHGTRRVGVVQWRGGGGRGVVKRNVSKLKAGRTARGAGCSSDAQHDARDGRVDDAVQAARTGAMRASTAAAVAAARAATAAAEETIASCAMTPRQVLQLPSSGSCSGNVRAKQPRSDVSADDDGSESEVHGRGVKKKRV